MELRHELQKKALSRIAKAAASWLQLQIFRRLS
jgi:hypothetical protein